MLKYKELHGNMEVPYYAFVVFSSNDWPEKTWGMQLGSTVSIIRSKGVFVRDDADWRKWFEEQGFVFDVCEQQWENVVVPALLKFKELHGNMDVPVRFTVPSSDGDWPGEIRCMRLGRSLGRIRSQGIFVRDDADRKQWLEEQSSVWKMRLRHAEKVRTAAGFYGRYRHGAAEVGC